MLQVEEMALTRTITAAGPSHSSPPTQPHPHPKRGRPLPQPLSPRSSSSSAVSFINNRRMVGGRHARPMTGAQGKERAKPRWALTEAQEDAELEEQAVELLSFTEQLDFEQWEQQMEADAEQQPTAEDEAALQQAEQERAHTASSQHASAVDGQDGTATDSNAQPAAELTSAVRPWTQQHLQHPATSIRPTTSRPSSSPARSDLPSTSSPDETTGSPTSSVAALASALLQSQPQLRAIHSAHSLRALITRGGSKAAPVSAGGCVEDEFVNAVYSCSVAIPEPRIAVIRERVACNAKVDPSHLPYLHRHPAV